MHRFAGETPASSPDGERLAFVRRSGGRRDVWTASPDGLTIAYASNHLADNEELYGVQADGTAVRRLVVESASRPAGAGR